LPVHSFSVRFAGEKQVHLQWLPSADELEPTAIPDGYIVQTAIDDNDFDNGVWVKDTKTILPIKTDKFYHFRITAVNAGGKSFPSETLSVYRKSEQKGTVLVINGFDRISAPASFASTDSLAGFLDFMDHGVADKNEYNYIGSQYEFRRKIPWMDNDATGFGASNTNYETTVLAGNTFNYPQQHGASIVKAGFSFVSASAQAVINGQVDMNIYPVVDLILGQQRQTQTGRGAFPPRYKTFPDSLQTKISAYCRQGGNIFVSGAYIGTDMWDTPFVKESDKIFTQEVLKYRWRTNHAAVTGKVKSVASPILQIKDSYQYHHQLNSVFYAVQSPDAIEPAGDGSYTVFRYSENNLSAGIAYSGDYKVCALGFPFEAICDAAERDRMMMNILKFFNSF